MERMAVPQPTSRTTLSLKMCLFWTIAFMYERVRTSSFCIWTLSAPSQYSGRERGGGGIQGLGGGMAGEGNIPAFPRGCLQRSGQRVSFRYLKL